MTRIDDVPSMQRSGPSRSDSQPCSVRLRLSPVAPRHLTTTLVPLTPGSFVVLYKFVLNALPPSPGRGAPTPPARARSSATPFSIPRPLPRTLPSLTTPRRPRPAPLDGRADAPGVAVQANAAMMLRAGGRACESLREARAADRDRAAGVEGETVLTVSPSPLPTVPDPCATIPPTAYLIQLSTARDWQPSQTQHVRKRRTASRADEFQRRAQTIRVQCQSAPVPSLAGR
ncbi:hypothetical protein AcW1_005086 [Taiwanofungus camphoratus]|nr:hypothetical protein AcW1_005086 [Antrodia cinnamomea]